VLAGEAYDSVAQMLQGSYMLRLSLWAAGAGLVFAVVAGLLLFALLTRRLRTLTAKMDAFQQCEVPPRSHVFQPSTARPVQTPRGDEIDRLDTTFRALTQRICQQVQTLQQTDTLRRELVAHVSHDLRTPLAALHGYIETLFLKDHQLTPQERQHYLDIAMQHSTRLRTLVAELFELAKLDAHETQVYPEAFSLAELVQDVVQKFQLMAQQQQQQLQAQLADDLPFVHADIALIERVLDNLIQNALQYTAPGGTITVALSLQPHSIAVQVMDSGTGILPADLPYIFDPFYRAEQGRQNATDGVGLGLAIAKRIVELHGSAITVDSSVQGGTTFTFHLPISYP
jgi:two-component system OmpR family sensor kinase